MADSVVLAVTDGGGEGIGMWRLAIRVVLLFTVIIGFCIALGAYMDYASIRGAYLGVIDSRMQVVARRLRQTIETAQSLGIRVAEQHTLPRLLAEQRQAAPLLLSIDVYNPSGQVLFSSTPARAGLTLDPRTTRDPRAYRLAVPIVNDLGLTTGGLLLRYDRHRVDQRLAELSQAIVQVALPALLAALALGGGGVMLLLLRLRRRTASLEQVLAHSPAARSAAAEITALQQQLDQPPQPSSS